MQGRRWTTYQHYAVESTRGALQSDFFEVENALLTAAILRADNGCDSAYYIKLGQYDTPILLYMCGMHISEFAILFQQNF